MIALEKFFHNPFDTNKISDDKLGKFTLDHIQKLIAADTNGALTNLITDTQQAYDDYFGATSSEDVKFAVQQALTRTMNM